MGTQPNSTDSMSETLSHRLSQLEFHVVDIRDRQDNYEDALRELAVNMNKIAVQLAERESDREKLREVTKEVLDSKNEFQAYKERQLEERVRDSKAWIKDSIRWAAEIVAAVLIFKLTNGLLSGH